MTLLKKALQNVIPRSVGPSITSSYSPMGTSIGAGGYLNYARQGYAGNEIVYSAIELLATSAAEPHIIGRRWRRERRQIRTQAKLWEAIGIPNHAGARAVDALLVLNGFWEELEEHPLVRILNKPNPFMSRGQLWSTVVMDRALAGNAYLLKARYQEGLIAGAVGELWRLRPDRVRIVPIGGGDRVYEYRVGNDTQTFASRDVIQFKTRNPFDEYYGMPPLLPISGRIDIDNYMRGFLKTFFERGGTGPGSILSTKGKMEQKDKDEARERFRRQFGGNGGWHEMLILDNADGTTYEQMGLSRGLRDALPKELDQMNEARIAMIFGIPGSILGLLIGYESSSYANKRQDWQVLWDITMTPLLSDFDDVLNLSFKLGQPDAEFGGIDEVAFDLSDIRALQEDVDKLQERARKNVVARIWTMEEGRALTGVGPAIADEHFLLPDGTAVKVSELDAEPPAPTAISFGTRSAALLEHAVRLMMPAGRGPGRPRVEEDDGAREVYERAIALRESNPNMTWEQVSARVGVVERTLRKYRTVFDDD